MDSPVDPLDHKASFFSAFQGISHFAPHTGRRLNFLAMRLELRLLLAAPVLLHECKQAPAGPAPIERPGHAVECHTDERVDPSP